MIDAYIAVLHAQWFFFISYGWVMVPIAAFFMVLHIFLRHRDSE